MRRFQHRKKRMAQTAMHSTLTETVRFLALSQEGAFLPQGPGKPFAGRWRASRDYQRLRDCQTQWMAYRASCCASRAVAVPIGCNHRLCPLCNAQRLEHYRGPARRMLAGMDQPYLPDDHCSERSSAHAGDFFEATRAVEAIQKSERNDEYWRSLFD